MKRHCSNSWCGRIFEIADEDLIFYDAVSPVIAGKKHPIPPPTLCPDCRQQRRLAHRNERCLYHRTCDLTDKQIVSLYSQDKPYTVYDRTQWYSDVWDGVTYGRDIDFGRLFFEQFAELQRVVPRLSLINTGGENSDYANWTIDLKNCYLLAGSRDDEDCFYGQWLWRSKDCVDTSHVFDSERCYECMDCSRCHSVIFSDDCKNCSDSSFLRSCGNCVHCFGCTGQHGKRHCFFNEQCTPENYATKLADFLPLTPARIAAVQQKVSALAKEIPKKYYHGFAIERCTGDYLEECNDCRHCFDVSGCERCAYGEHLMRTDDTMDCSRSGLSELCLDCLSPVNAQHAAFSIMCWYGSDLLYSEACLHSQHLFGCVGLRHKRCCILNKQYTNEEYERLALKLIEHMRATDEWGASLPPTLSPFGYNETEANAYYPLSKEQALQRGWQWHDEARSPQSLQAIASSQIPDTIDATGDDILDQSIECEATKKPFRIVGQELAFYRNMRLPIPRLHPDERHRRRMALRNPRKLWKRHCDNCRKPMQTSYPPQRPEKVFCEECYLTVVY